MKYGLREEKPKKKWKAAVENELVCLKTEVGFLKDRLDDALSRLTKFSSFNRSDPVAPKQGLPRNKNPFSLVSENDNNNNFSRKNGSLPPFSVAFNTNHNQRLLADGLGSPQENPFASISMGADRPRYESTWDYDTLTRKSLRLHSISCMPSYKDKSCEELRYEDYVLKGIGFSNQIQRYKDSIQRSRPIEFTLTSKDFKHFERKNSEGCTNTSFRKELGSSFVIPWYLTPKPPKAPWPFGPSPGIKKPDTSTSNSIASNVPQTSIESLLRDEQYKKEHLFALRRNAQTQSSFDAEIQNFPGISTKDEDSSSRILLDLRKMGEQVLTISDRLSKMDSNLSDMSSRMCVMDSRLSAVDVFVTMQKFDKKWEGVETRLDNLETIRDRLSNMESNLSDVSSRMSVMDSRLSAVDMFVTMQTFDKKWEGVETRLVNLEMPSPDRVTTSPISNSEDKVCPLSKGIALQEEMDMTLSFGNEKINDSQISELKKSDANPPLKHVGTMSVMDTSDINLSDFVRSVSCTDITMGSKSIYTTSLSDNDILSISPLKIKLDNASIEMANLKSFTSCALIEDLSIHENESVIDKSKSEPMASQSDDNCSKQIKEIASLDEEKTSINKVILCNITKKTPEGKKQVHEPELQTNSLGKENNKDIISNDPLGVVGQKDSLNTKADDSEIENDADNEFVIIEKSDVEESEEKSVSLNEASSSSGFRMYSDITEYLEINLGKKKNLVYEFGFEAKPDFSLEPGDHDKKLDETQESRASVSSANDSFQQFKINFIENKAVDEKQSSPFVLFAPKLSEKPPGKNG